MFKDLETVADFDEKNPEPCRQSLLEASFTPTVPNEHPAFSVEVPASTHKGFEAPSEVLETSATHSEDEDFLDSYLQLHFEPESEPESTPSIETVEPRHSPAIESNPTPPVIKDCVLKDLAFDTRAPGVLHDFRDAVSEQKKDSATGSESMTSLNEAHLHEPPQRPMIPSTSEPEPPPEDLRSRPKSAIQSATLSHRPLDPAPACFSDCRDLNVEPTVSDREIPSSSSCVYVASAESPPIASKDCTLDVLIDSIEDLLSRLEPTSDLEDSEDYLDEHSTAFFGPQACDSDDHDTNPEDGACLAKSPKPSNGLQHHAKGSRVDSRLLARSAH